jgi:hypothetical protein
MTDRNYMSLSGIIRMLTVWAALLLWQRVADRLGCFLSTLFLLPLWIVLTLAASEAALIRRHAFVVQYLRTEGLLARLLRRKTVLLLWQTAKTLILALVLLVGVVFLDPVQWLVLLADTLLMVILVILFSRILDTELKSGYCSFLGRHGAHWANTALLWLCLVLVTFYTAHENYTGMTWQEAIHSGVSKVRMACDELAFLGRMNAAGEALMWWGAQNYLQGLERPALLIMAWLAFIAFFAVSFLIAWAYSRALVGVIARPWAIDPDRLSRRD